MNRPILIILWSLLSGSSLFAQRLIINEIVANNVSIMADDSAEYDDFIELHNAGNSKVDIAGMYFSEGKSAKKWKIPEGEPQITSIRAGDYKIIWFDKDEEQGELHAGFNLNSGGESLILYDKNETIVDSITFPRQYPDYSYGRLEQGSDWSYLLTPTPGEPNSEQQQISWRCPNAVIMQKGGFFDSEISVEIKVPDGCEVFMTFDSKTPQFGISKKYEGAFKINKTTVVRAAAFKNGYLPSEIVTETFFVNEKHSLPVVSLVTDPFYLWDAQAGSYVNPFKNFERPVNFEYFDKSGREAINLQLGLKIFGYTSRNSSKQSFSVQAKERFGNERIAYSFFEDKPEITGFDGLILRGDVTSGRGGGDRETAGEHVRNELIYQINKDAGKNVDIQAYQPVALFLNGKYWGLYSLMEQKGKGFIRDNYGIKDIDMLNRDDLEVVAGDTIEFQKMLRYVLDENLMIDSVFEPLYSQIDVKSVIDYWIFEIYSSTHDYHVNIRIWRPRTEDGKWRWIAYDEDSWGWSDEPSFYNMTTELYPQSVFFWNFMLENDGFRNAFVNRFADLLNTVLLPENIIRMIDEIQFVIRSEKIRDYERWKNLVNFVEPGSQIAAMKEFAEKRPDYIRNDILERFELQGMSSFSMSVQGKGKIQVNSIQPETYPWQGIYFFGVPVTLTAIPDKGHRFIGWEGFNANNSESVILYPIRSIYTINALFE